MIEKISLILDALGIKDKDFERIIGLPAGRLSKWKKSAKRKDSGEVTAKDWAKGPSAVEGLKMARRLGVPLDYLADEAMPVPSGRSQFDLLSEDEISVVAVFRAMRLDAGEAIRRLTGVPNAVVVEPIPPYKSYDGQLATGEVTEEELESRKSPGRRNKLK